MDSKVLRNWLLGILMVGAIALSACDSQAGEEGNGENNDEGKLEELEGTLGERTCTAIESALSRPLVTADNSGTRLVFHMDYPDGWSLDRYLNIFSPRRSIGDGEAFAINLQQRDRVNDAEEGYQTMISLYRAVEVGTSAYGGETIRLMRAPGEAGHYTLLPHGDGYIEIWIAHGGEYDASDCMDSLYELKERMMRSMTPNADTTTE